MKLGVYFVTLPNIKQPRLRWITRKRSDGRFMMRIPKIGAKVKDVFLKRPNVFGPEVLVPKGSKIE